MLHLRGKIWHTWYTDATGRRRSKTTRTGDRRAAERFRARMIEDARTPEAERVALEDARPLVEHLDGYLSHLQAKGCTLRHCRQTEGVLRRFFETTAATHADHLTPARADSFVNTCRKVGNGAATVNHARAIVKAFSAWLETAGRSRGNRLRPWRKLNAATDRRRERRVMLPDELAHLLSHTATAGNAAGLTGPMRAILYGVATCTGLRAGELRSLTREDFNLGDKPEVILRAKNAKSRKDARQPLALTVADALRPMIEPLPPASRPFARALRTAEMLRADMAAARAAWIEAGADESTKAARAASDFLTPKNARGEVLDFHALRHTFIDGLRLAGVDMKTAQVLARHSDARLTIGIYSHATTDQVRAAAPGLPSMPKEAAA